MIKRPFLVLLTLLPLYLTWTFDHALWNPDETRDAGIAAEMYRTGSFAVPTLNGVAFLEKPPLYYWSCALLYKLTGRVTAGTTRLPSALYGFLGILFTFLIGRRLYNDRVGLMAALMLATSLQYFRMSHFAMMDVSLAALITGALYFYLKFFK
jgi:4-amino-4-deoxy-L-arabinose transferase-like glycosyltransferase